MVRVWLTWHVGLFADLVHSKPQAPASVPGLKTGNLKLKHKLLHGVQEMSSFPTSHQAQQTELCQALGIQHGRRQGAARSGLLTSGDDNK